MKAKHLLNLFLVSIVGILIAFTIYEPGHIQNQKTALLSNFDPQKVETLILYRDGAQILKVQRQVENKQSYWQIKQPFDLPANSFRINALLSIANNHSYSQIDARQHDLEKFGLKKPHISLHYDNKVISFGATDPLNFRRYVLVDYTIHLINDGSYQHLVQEDTNFVSYKLLPVNKVITKIEMPGVVLSKNTVNGNWDITPENKRTSLDEITQFIQDWQTAQATDITRWPANLILAGELKKNTEDSINIQFADNSKLSLVVIDNKSDLILGKKKSRLQYHLPETLKSKLLWPVDAVNKL